MEAAVAEEAMVASVGWAAGWVVGAETVAVGLAAGWVERAGWVAAVGRSPTGWAEPEPRQPAPFHCLRCSAPSAHMQSYPRARRRCRLPSPASSAVAAGTGLASTAPPLSHWLQPKGLGELRRSCTLSSPPSTSGWRASTRACSCGSQPCSPQLGTQAKRRGLQSLSASTSFWWAPRARTAPAQRCR